ncbi:MAG: glutaredoxin family protein [Burkholderiales bacterium]|nr:glutaredoxin family protein [Burkholderiales bacterium]
MRIFTAFSLLAFALAAQAQLYRWTDESGKVHYSDTQPPATATNVEEKRRIRAGGAATQQSYELQQAVANFPVTVYTSKDCGDPCKKGLDYLKKRGVPFTEKVIATQNQIDELAKLAGAPKVPVMVVGISIQKGYAEQGWSEALDTAGYPKTGSP